MENNDKFWELATAKVHNEISGVESGELDRMLKNEKHRELFREIQALNKELGELEDITGISQKNSWNRISSHLRAKKIRLLLTITKYAAIVAFAFLLGNVLTNKENKPDEIAGFTEVNVPPGQMSELTLFDGTKVWLNSGTTLRYGTGFGKENRNISLEGEAFFAVTKDVVPFKVKLTHTEVEVLGTRFNVLAYNEDAFSQVTLVEGSVNVNSHSGCRIAELKPSQQIQVDHNSKKATVSAVDTTFFTSWTQGKIVFDDEKLSQVAQKMERWYNVDIRFKDAAAGELHFTGTILKNKPFDQIITAFELLLPVEITYTKIINGKDIIVFSQK